MSNRIPLITRMTRAPLLWLLHGLALMPMSWLHGLSSALAPMVRLVIRYRLGVVRDNLRQCFPDLDSRQLHEIERRFYLNFTDYVVETIKLMHISDDEMRQRFTFGGMEHIDRLFDQGRSVVAYFSHTGNWEWTTSITLHGRYTAATAEYCQVYRPLKDKWFDRLFLHLRSRFGSRSFAKSTVFRDLIRLRHEGKPNITGFMSDQKPSHGDPTLPLMFLNRPTAMITGTETLARRLDMAVVYLDMRRTGRGRYHIDVIPMAGSAAATAPGELTHAYARLLEQTIKRDPAIWLWTHKRWKNPVTMP